MLLTLEIQQPVVASPALGAACSDFNWLYNRFSEMSHIWTRLTWFERSQSAVGPRQWETIFIVWDIGVWALFSCCVDTAGCCGLFLFCSMLWKKHILITEWLYALKLQYSPQPAYRMPNKRNTISLILSRSGNPEGIKCSSEGKHELLTM